MAQSRQVERDAAVLEQVRPDEQQKTEPVPLLTGGIHTEKSPNELQLNEVVAMSGVHFVAGRLVVDTGYVPFSHEFIGAPQLVRQILYSDATQTTLLITSELVYTYDAAHTQWKLASLDSIRTTTSNYNIGDTVIELDTGAGITAGTYVGVTLSDGSQFITQVVSVILPPNSIQIAPLPQTVNNGAEVFVGYELNGDPTVSQCVGVLFAGNEWFIFSNGIDPIAYYYQGVVTALGGLPTATTCRAMTVFHSMLLIGNTTENGTRLPTRVRQSDLADPEGWDPGVDGIAAIYDLLDTPDDVLNIKPLGAWVLCYRAASVMRGSFIGAIGEIIFWEYMSQEDGIQSQGAVADVGSYHILVGTNNVYQYQGSYDLPPIGEPVFQNFLARSGDLYAPAKGTLFCAYVPVLREVWIFYPSSDVTPPPGAPTYPNKMLRFNTALKSWQERVFADEFISSGTYTPQEITTWATAPGQWDDTIWARPWNSRSSVANVPNIFLGPPAQTQLYVYDYAALTDAGDTISYEIITREYGDANEFRRWQNVKLLGLGAATIELSQDGGNVWSALGTIDCGATEASDELWPDLVSTRLSLRITGTDSNFELRYGRISSEFESEW